MRKFSEVFSRGESDLARYLLFLIPEFYHEGGSR